MGRLEDLARSLGEGRMTPPDDSEVEEHFPDFWEMMTVDKWADGKERILPTVKVERSPGGYRVVIQDDSLCVQKRLFVRRWLDILQAIEKALSDPEIPWEPFKSYRNKHGPPIPDEKPTRRKKR